MSGGKPSANTKLTANAATTDHDYIPMETSASLAHKRKNPPATPTKTGAPPQAKMKTAQEQSYDNLVDAIAKLTDKVDGFGTQLRETATMVASITRLVEINTADIKDCQKKIKELDKDIPGLVQENKELKERITELERYKRRWNLKIHGIKEKDDEQIREEVIHTLSQLAPQWADTMGTIVDSVHRLGKRENGRNRQVIIQFVMRYHREEFWRMTKNSRFCKEAGIRFKQDFCKADREARAAAWPKMDQARADGKNVWFRGHVGYIDGKKVAI